MKPELRPFFLFLLVLGSSSARAEKIDANQVVHGLVNMDPKFIYLFDRANHNRHAVKVTEKVYLPNRVYIRYDADEHMWMFVKTDFGGYFPSPLEALRPKTVTKGEVIGAELALQRFILRQDGTWMPTKDKEEYQIWIKGKPPVLKSYTYEKLPETIQHVAPGMRMPTSKSPRK